MKKLSILAMMLVLAAGAAMAAPPYPVVPLNGPNTLDNMDSCDILNAPAATLLLPYFEVDPAGAGDNTLLAVTNVSDRPIVAHVVIWTNWSFPVLDFNVFLTGYDVATMSLRDILIRGNLPSTGDGISPRGTRSMATNAHATFAGCGINQGGNGAIPANLLAQVQSALTGGPYSAGGVPCAQVGDVSDNMIGYITIDVAAVCSQKLPDDATYFTTDILFDNQLIGDYIRINDTDGYAGANPMVQIRAISPGGLTIGGGGVGTTFLPWTFYQRYNFNVLNTVRDRRVPLPALFAGRYIESTAMDTDYVIWREGVTDDLGTQDCNGALVLNSNFAFTEFVRFDERENPQVRTGGCTISPCPPSTGLSETQLVNVNSSQFPADPSTDAGGWMYFNLSIPAGDPMSWGRPSQNWVQIRMTAPSYGVDFDASYLGNGCAWHQGVTALGSVGGIKIGPLYGRAGELLP